MTNSAGAASRRAPACGALPFWPAVRTKPTGHPVRAQQVDLGAQARLASVRWPDFEPPFCTAGVLVSADNRGVYDQVLEIWVIRHGFEDTLPKLSYVRGCRVTRLPGCFHPRDMHIAA
jgi:hypothetical protein